MCGVPVHAAESYLARLIRGGHRVAIAEQTESPAEARKARGSKALVDRAIVRLVTPGTLTEETLLESVVGQLAGGDRAGGRGLGASPPPTFRPAGSSWSPAASASWRPSSRASHRRRRSPTTTVPGLPTTAGKGGFDSLAGERALKARFGLATLDGLGSPTRAELAAAGGLLAYLDATQKGAGILLDAPRRVVALRPHGDRRRDPRQPRAVPLGVGKHRRKPARRDRPLPDRRRPAPACVGHFRAADRQGRDRAAPRARRLAARKRPAPRPHALRAQGHARLRPRARAGSPPDGEARATSPSCATA